MQGKIGLEEHFAIPETLGDSKGYLPDYTWPELESRLMDIQERRIAEMDRHGMQMMILSLNAPAIQAIPEQAWVAALDSDGEPREGAQVAELTNWMPTPVKPTRSPAKYGPQEWPAGSLPAVNALTPAPNYD